MSVRGKMNEATPLTWENLLSDRKKTRSKFLGNLNVKLLPPIIRSDA